MEKILLYGNGYCLTLNEFNTNKEKLTKNVEIYNAKKSIHKKIQFDFSNEGIYDFINFCIPLVFKGMDKDKFLEEIKKTNLEDIFTEMFFNHLEIDFANDNDISLLNESVILIDKNKFFPEQLSTRKNLINKIESFPDLIIFLNYLMEIWIKGCYENLSSSNSEAALKIRNGHDDIPDRIYEFKNFDYYWTTNFMNDKILYDDLNDDETFFINGKFNNANFDGIIFDGLINDGKTKSNLIKIGSKNDKRKELIFDNLIKIFEWRKKYESSSTTEKQFEIYLYGISPINDLPLFKFISFSKPDKIYYFYYQKNHNEVLDPFNENVKKELSKIFDEYYFLPHNLFSSEVEKTIEDIEKYKIKK